MKAIDAKSMANQIHTKNRNQEKLDVADLMHEIYEEISNAAIAGHYEVTVIVPRDKSHGIRITLLDDGYNVSQISNPPGSKIIITWDKAK